MKLPVESSDLADIVIQEVLEAEQCRVLQGYELLRQAIGADKVEDTDSFKLSISLSTDVAVAPKLVGALHGRDMVGFTVGFYLRNLKVGLVGYSAVREAWRRQGIYVAMREFLVALFDEEACEGRVQTCPYDRESGRVSYVISELEENSRLLRRYMDEWGAFALHCAYEQPEAHGLKSRPLKLVLQPIARHAPPDDDGILGIVREIYGRLYRIRDVEGNASFRRIVASLREVSVPVR